MKLSMNFWLNARRLETGYPGKKQGGSYLISFLLKSTQSMQWHFTKRIQIHNLAL
jgi:hypothetical protein